MVHTGSGDWIVVDSCIDRESDSPAVINYFRKIAVEPARSVKVVVATHWHDDHMRGLASVFAQCEGAKFVCSVSLRTKEFLTLVQSLGKRSMMSNSGVEEFYKILETLKSRVEGARLESRGPAFAMADQLIWRRENPVPAGVYALSPSSGTISLAYTEIAELLPNTGELKKRAVAQGANHVAVALWITVGDTAVLLGSDLEDSGNPTTGWTAIINSTTRPPGKASVFKIAHHGSKNADHPQIWSKMLMGNPFAVLTPFNQGKINLPTPRDVDRVCGQTSNAYATAHPGVKQTRRRYGIVEKTIRETVRSIRVLDRSPGHVRLRRDLRTADAPWRIELFEGAIDLKRAYA